MNNYYYSQRYSVYANEIIGQPNLTMANYGCLVCDCAMLISYFNDKPLYPDIFLVWLKYHNGLTKDGRLYWIKVCEATNDKLKFSYKPDAKQGEITYGLRQVYFGRLNHWILDHPLIPNKVIDSWDGKVKDYNSFKYTGQNRFFIGKK